MQGGGILEEFRNAFSKPNNSLFQIIWINVAVFVALNTLGVILWLFQISDFSPNQCTVGSADLFCTVLRFLEIPASVTNFLYQPWTLITYFFTHVNFFHILFNMLFLYWFGKLINEFLGDKKVVILYFLGGIAGGLLYILIYNVLPQFSERVEITYMLGASAGVFAIVVGAAVFMPNFTMYLLLFGPVRIKYIAIFYVLLSFFSLPGANAGGEIAHLGGAAIGFIYIKQLQKGNDIGGWIISSIAFVKSFFVRQPKIKVSYSSGDHASSKTKASGKGKTSRTTDANMPNQAEIDTILDKISQSGYESLSKDEKQKLFNASKK
jgi:membrane associated rhomboid family serine protease